MGDTNSGSDLAASNSLPDQPPPKSSAQGRFRQRPWFWVGVAMAGLWLVYAVWPGEPLPGGSIDRFTGGITAAIFTMLVYVFIVTSKAFAKSSWKTMMMNPSSTLEASLSGATNGWLLPVVIRRYPSGASGDRLFEREAAVLTKHGYEPALQTADGGHIHAGRLLLTGGLSVFAGRSGIRSEGSLAVTFRKASPPTG